MDVSIGSPSSANSPSTQIKMSWQKKIYPTDLTKWPSPKLHQSCRTRLLTYIFQFYILEQLQQCYKTTISKVNNPPIYLFYHPQLCLHTTKSTQLPPHHPGSQTTTRYGLPYDNILYFTNSCFVLCIMVSLRHSIEHIRFAIYKLATQYYKINFYDTVLHL